MKSLIRRILGFSKPPQEPAPDEIVQLVEMNDSYQAENLRQLLEGADIAVSVYPASFPATGVFGSLGTGGGTRVMVLYRDLAAAKEIANEFIDSIS